ncbi:hypothetical protein [Carboxylicivirga sp. RSCT41]|uniref:hypothetical protein n=1 Tax=Carboxylicivirga agarovorans TaxID=3417570 RepID=UPI003D338BC0
MTTDNAIIVRNKTRLEQLIERFNTKAQARFYIEHSGGDFNAYQQEHDCFYQSLEKIQRITAQHLKFKIIDRSFLPNFIFSENDCIVIVGQDGLVANTAKYAKGLPMLPVNPDTSLNDGVLLPFNSDNFQAGLLNFLNENSAFKQVTMAEATLKDGQKLQAFNDLFIGPATHTSARYKLWYNKMAEVQSSSGIIVSTGAGSTGWLSSLFNMANRINRAFDNSHHDMEMQMEWDDDNLVYIVREPFKSRHSNIQLSAGIIPKGQSLKIESHMPVNGKIFSDGLENDYLAFNAGSIAEIGIAKEKANIVFTGDLIM